MPDTGPVTTPFKPNLVCVSCAVWATKSARLVCGRLVLVCHVGSVGFDKAMGIYLRRNCSTWRKKRVVLAAVRIPGAPEGRIEKSLGVP